MKHISEQSSHFVVALHNAWSWLVYARRIGVVAALRHHHVFKRWTGARNLLCWCGSVRIESEAQNTYATRELAKEYFRTRDSLPDPPASYLKYAEEMLEKHDMIAKN